MYASLALELRCGDVFVELPIPVFDPDSGSFATDLGPAMAVDHDCQICKKNLHKLTFAPLFPLDNWEPGMQGTIRKGDVRHLFHLPAHEDLDDAEFVADLSETFTLPRRAFNLVSGYEDENPREHRWYISENSGLSERLLSLSEEGREQLLWKFVYVLRLDELLPDEEESGDS